MIMGLLFQKKIICAILAEFASGLMISCVGDNGDDTDIL